MVVRLSGTQPQGPKQLEILENKTVDGTQNTVRVNRGTTANRPIGPVIGDLYYNTELKDLEQYTEDGWLIVAKQPPRIPAIVSATLDGSNNASVSFTPSTYGQTASSFTVQSNPGSYTATSSSSPISISGTNLQVGTGYTFRVKSTGSYGDSAYSAYTSSALTPVILGSYESIQTVTVASGGTASISFTSIPQTYTHLQIRGITKVTYGSASVNGWGITQFNSDTAANYSYHALYGTGSTAGATATASTSAMLGFAEIGGTSVTNCFAVSVMDILDYTNTNKYKTLRILGGAEGNITDCWLYLGSGSWRSTSAITSITLTNGSGAFTQYSSFALYGIKGS